MKATEAPSEALNTFRRLFVSGKKKDTVQQTQPGLTAKRQSWQERMEAKDAEFKKREEEANKNKKKNEKEKKKKERGKKTDAALQKGVTAAQKMLRVGDDLTR